MFPTCLMFQYTNNLLPGSTAPDEISSAQALLHPSRMHGTSVPWPMDMHLPAHPRIASARHKSTCTGSGTRSDAVSPAAHRAAMRSAAS
jgi:hypothetical protein